MKKIFLMLAAMMLLCSVACAASADEAKLKIVTTIFPQYDWVREITSGDLSRVDLTMLADSGVDLHSFQPSVDDILKVSTCDLFVYVGGESDRWVERALAEAANKEMRVIKLLDVLGDRAKEEELVEGMESDEDEHEHGDKHEHEEGAAYDEHVWLSLVNARLFVSALADAICEMDPAHAETYRANAASYDGKLAELDAEYRSAVGAAKFDTLVFGDRFPFRYMVDDYGLRYYAAFAGCSAETEASFETVTFLAGKVDELGLHTIVAIEGSDRRLAETIAQNTASKGQRVVMFDSMQSVTAKDVANGITYLSIMRDDLAALTEALR